MKDRLKGKEAHFWVLVLVLFCVGASAGAIYLSPGNEPRQVRSLPPGATDVEILDDEWATFTWDDKHFLIHTFGRDTDFTQLHDDIPRDWGYIMREHQRILNKQ